MPTVEKSEAKDPHVKKKSAGKAGLREKGYIAVLLANDQAMGSQLDCVGMSIMWPLEICLGSVWCRDRHNCTCIVLDDNP